MYLAFQSTNLQICTWKFSKYKFANLYLGKPSTFSVQNGFLTRGTAAKPCSVLFLTPNICSFHHDDASSLSSQPRATPQSSRGIVKHVVVCPRHSHDSLCQILCFFCHKQNKPHCTMNDDDDRSEQGMSLSSNIAQGEVQLIVFSWLPHNSNMMESAF